MNLKCSSSVSVLREEDDWIPSFQHIAVSHALISSHLKTRNNQIDPLLILGIQAHGTESLFLSRLDIFVETFHFARLLVNFVASVDNLVKTLFVWRQLCQSFPHCLHRTRFACYVRDSPQTVVKDCLQQQEEVLCCRLRDWLDRTRPKRHKWYACTRHCHKCFHTPPLISW